MATSDTDRLAALLHEAGIACDAHGPLRIGRHGDVHGVHAARLIAAGVTLDPRPDPDAALREAAEAVVRQAEPDDNFDGEFIEYLVPWDAIGALRLAIERSGPKP